MCWPAEGQLGQVRKLLREEGGGVAPALCRRVQKDSGGLKREVWDKINGAGGAFK